MSSSGWVRAGQGIYPPNSKSHASLPPPSPLYHHHHHSAIPIPSTDSHSTYILPPLLIAPPHHSNPICNKIPFNNSGTILQQARTIDRAQEKFYLLLSSIISYPCSGHQLVLWCPLFAHHLHPCSGPFSSSSSSSSSRPAMATRHWSWTRRPPTSPR